MVLNFEKNCCKMTKKAGSKRNLLLSGFCCRAERNGGSGQSGTALNFVAAGMKTGLAGGECNTDAEGSVQGLYRVRVRT